MKGEKYEGKPCVKCGSTTRYVSVKKCVECICAADKARRDADPGAKKARSKAWRVANPEKQRAQGLLGGARGRARKFGLEFSLTERDIHEMIAETGGICPARGVPFTLGGKMNANSATLDRVTPSEGYTRENCAIISKRANNIKSDVTHPKDLYQVADWLHEKLKNKPRNTNGNNEC